jgi:hypothetical protein
LDVCDARRMRALDSANAKLRWRSTGTMFDNIAEASGSQGFIRPVIKQEAVPHGGRNRDLRRRRICARIGVSRQVTRYHAMRRDDAPFRARSHALAAERRRFGFCRRCYLVAREGMASNQKTLSQFYREESPQVCRRDARKRASGTRASMLLPGGASQDSRRRLRHAVPQPAGLHPMHGRQSHARKLVTGGRHVAVGRRPPFSAGRLDGAARGIASHRASLCKTAWPKASKASSG